MLNRFRQWMNELPVQGLIERQQATLFQVLLFGILGVFVLTVALNVIIFGVAALAPGRLFIYAVGLLCLAGALTVLRRGHLHASVDIVIGAVLITQIQSLFAMGFRASAGSLVVFAVAITLAGLLVGRLTMLITTGVSMAVVVAVFLLEQSGSPLVGSSPASSDPISPRVVGFVLSLGVLGVIVDQFGLTLRKALVAAVQREAELKQAEANLQAANEKLKAWLAEVEQRNREIELLNKMGDMLQACVTLEDASEVITEIGRQLFSNEAGAVYLMDPSHMMMETAARWGNPPPEDRMFEPSECWALRRGQAHLFDVGTPNLVCRHMRGAAPEAYVCVPMMAQGEALGMLHVRQVGPNPRPGQYFTDNKLRLLRAVAESVVLAVANLRLREDLRHQSIRDPLTGIFNRRYMEETLERELRRSIRSLQPVGVIMLDLDHFKRFNDTFGHEAGDLLLRELAGLLQLQVRVEDVVCRYGGEEFALILPEATLETTQHRAEKLREAACHLSVRYGSQMLGPVTISLGIAVYPYHGSTGMALLRAADEALYRAKLSGRNRVVVSEGSGSSRASG